MCLLAGKCYLFGDASSIVYVGHSRLIMFYCKETTRVEPRRKAESRGGEDSVDAGQGHYIFGCLGALRSTMARSSSSSLSSSSQRLLISSVEVMA